MSLRTDVDRGLAITAQIEQLKSELKAIATRLQIAGLQAGERGEHEPLKDAERDGMCWLARGSSVAVPLIFTADNIVGSFTTNSEKHFEIRAAGDGQFGQFFKPVNKYENKFSDGKKFRRTAEEILGAQAPAFITACVARDKDGIAKSSLKILWEETEIGG